MILTSHAVFGAAVASVVPTHPVIGFALGFASHFVLDAIPHKDYSLRSIDSGNDHKIHFVKVVNFGIKLIRDILVVSMDALVGIILAFMFFFDPQHIWIFLIGAIAGILPDFIKFLYLISKNKFIVYFDYLHYNFFHSKKHLSVSQPVGVFLQFLIVFLLILVMELLCYEFLYL